MTDSTEQARKWDGLRKIAHWGAPPTVQYNSMPLILGETEMVVSRPSWAPTTPLQFGAELSSAVLIGEQNPYSERPADALLPYPAMSAGARLLKILGWTRDEYLASFFRLNLIERGEKWSMVTARIRAQTVIGVHAGDVVMLGSKVAAAFGCKDLPDWEKRGRFLRLPHPSGLCRKWNDDGAVDRTRRVMEPYRRRVST